MSYALLLLMLLMLLCIYYSQKLCWTETKDRICSALAKPFTLFCCTTFLHCAQDFQLKIDVDDNNDGDDDYKLTMPSIDRRKNFCLRFCSSFVFLLLLLSFCSHSLHPSYCMRNEWKIFVVAWKIGVAGFFYISIFRIEWNVYWDNVNERDRKIKRDQERSDGRKAERRRKR